MVSHTYKHMYKFKCLKRKRKIIHLECDIIFEMIEVRKKRFFFYSVALTEWVKNGIYLQIKLCLIHVYSSVSNNLKPT